MPTRQYDRFVFAVRGLLSSPRETPAPFVAQDNLSRCLCSRSSSPLHTFINSGRTELYFHIPLPRRSFFFFFFFYLFCNTSPWCINTEGLLFSAAPLKHDHARDPFIQAHDEFKPSVLHFCPSVFVCACMLCTVSTFSLLNCGVNQKTVHLKGHRVVFSFGRTRSNSELMR